MSQPLLSGEQLTVAVEANIVRVTNDPGFTSDNGDGCPYRWPYITDARNQVIYGYPKPGRELAENAQVLSRDQLASMRWTLGIGTYVLRVYAGTFFKGWGDVPDNYIEWGYTDQGKNPSGVPRVNEVRFVVGAIAPPPTTEKDELIQVLQATKQVNAASVPFKLGWKAAKTVDAYLTDAIARAKRL